MNDLELFATIAVVLIVAALAIVGGYVVGCIKTRRGTPGADVFNSAQKNGTTPILDAFGDSYAQWVEGEKSVSGSVLINHGTDTETIDQTVIDRAPSLLIGGIRSLIRCRMSAATMPLTDAGHTQLVMDHYDQPGIYPTLHKLGLYDHEWMFTLRNDLPIIKEMISSKCIIEKAVPDEKDPQKLVIARVIDETLLKEAMDEVDQFRKNVSYVPKRDVFIDVPRVVNSTQLVFAPFVLKNITAIITAIITSQFERKYQGLKGIPIWHYPACILGGFFAATICFKILGL